MLIKLILDCSDRHAPLKRTTDRFTRQSAPWMKQLDIFGLQKQHDKYRFHAHNIPSKENWMNFRNARKKLKKKITDTKTAFYRKFYHRKIQKKFGKLFTLSSTQATKLSTQIQTS